MSIKAIETRYKGYRFRSRLEARWAVFFDAWGALWEYEYEGYDLGSGQYYLPDFRLSWVNHPDHAWIEIKGQDPSDIERLKIEKLARGTKDVAMIVFGPPGVERCALVNPDDGAWFTGKDIDFYPVWCDFLLCEEFHRRFVARGLDPYRQELKEKKVEAHKHTCTRLQRAYVAARSARFEHGESP